MGIRESRAIQRFQSDIYPLTKSTIDEAAGFDVLCEVHWNTLAVEGYDHLYESALPKIYFKPIADALRELCADDTARAALQSALKKIVVTNSGQHTQAPECFDLSEGVLTFDHRPTTHIDEVESRATALQRLLADSI